MVDIVDSATRSRMMSGIRGKNTKPEILIRKSLHKKGFRFRLHAKDLPGKPDIVLPKYHAAIFVHGCFWHGHSCELFKWPQTRPEFWQEKIGRNQKNDALAKEKLLAQGWRVCVIWECALRSREPIIDDITVQITTWLTGNTSSFEVSKISLQSQLYSNRP